MRTPISTWLPAALGALVLSAFAGDAAAQCHDKCEPPKPPCCQPPPPPPPPPPQPPCCRPPSPPDRPYEPGGGDINIEVNVRANANAEATARSAANASARSGAYGNVRLGNGGGGGAAYVTVEQPYPTLIQGLNVEAAAVAQVVRIPYEERRRFEKRVVIQAVCIDDRAVPHPASQVRPDREVFGDYDGELYRCIAGSWLQVTIADYLDHVSFDGGETMACAKGEALWHGAGGMIECRPQKHERDCNERSLLRRYGAGIKILTIVREEIVQAWREEVQEVAGASVFGASMTLDGGVGGRVF